jgi:hypothetical protein
VPLTPWRPSAARPITRIETDLVVLARGTVAVPCLDGPGKATWLPLGPPKPQASTAETGWEAS